VVHGDGTVVAAVHVHGPTYRFPRRGTEAAIAADVMAAARRVSEKLDRP
jgi:DNA-binding IclR family transcriptional regulator